jgi:hypothetical protein
VNNLCGGCSKGHRPAIEVSIHYSVVSRYIPGSAFHRVEKIPKRSVCPHVFFRTYNLE